MRAEQAAATLASLLDEIDDYRELVRDRTGRRPAFRLVLASTPQGRRSVDVYLGGELAAQGRATVGVRAEQAALASFRTWAADQQAWLEDALERSRGHARTI